MTEPQPQPCSQCARNGPAKEAKKRPKKRRMLCQTKPRLRWEPCEHGCKYHPGRRLMLAERFEAAKRSGLTGDELAAYRHCPCVELDFETTKTVIHCPAWQIKNGRRIYPPPPPPPNRVPDFVYLGVDEETEQRNSLQEKHVMPHSFFDPEFVKNRLVPYDIYTTVRVYRSPKVELTFEEKKDMIRVVMIHDFARESMRYLYPSDGEEIQGITYDVDRLPKTTKVLIYEVERTKKYRPKDYKVIQEINGDAKETAQKLGFLKAV
ncbi:hypothetical protein F503_03595 [Ophiostoma piceae UAMH 11346]|uniref:Uncharacterized protein n=1 Tax=Ophiostoma piceae (strain UAMH 11346) TaxID=1262450 RepID=S3CDW3_OPHP1|nr:hypothetical protein F503_03595 [Ophiostoma piceae UAMH 11346]